ncbi:MAG: hypothetical protein HW419_4165 [Deltaproteobacteria bacterium]|nr:hypothetical protein [Deltaproteobacteria bacterium]
MQRSICSGGGYAGKKTALAEDFQRQITAEVEALIGTEATAHLDFEAIETAARRDALKVAAYAVARRLNADHTDHRGPTAPCGCGQSARYAGRYRKSFQTVLGEMTLERAYYHCSACQHGYFPRDRVLGIVNTALSPALTRMIGLVGAMVSFEEGAELLGELAGVRVNAKQVERTAEALGREIAADEYQRLEPIANDQIPPTLYLGMDGTGVPMRAAELAGRQGKQPDGSAKTREVKLCTVWSAEARDAQGTPVRDEGSITYSAAIESAASRDTDTIPSRFAQRVMREAVRRGFERAARQVVLGDGAAWIWNLADEYLPHAIQIVDRFHVKQHLSDVAKAVYSPGSDLATQWARQRHDELDTGEIDKIIAALALHAKSCQAASQCIDYLQNNRARMRYHEFRAQGLCTSTGVVEAGCKLAIGTRLKRAGMHWTLSGANAIIALRCCKLSARFADFWEVRAQRAATA